MFRNGKVILSNSLLGIGLQVYTGSKLFNFSKMGPLLTSITGIIIALRYTLGSNTHSSKNHNVVTSSAAESKFLYGA